MMHYLKKLVFWLILAIALSSLISTTLAQDTEASSYESYDARFESAWRLVAERYWELSYLARDWDEVYQEYKPRIANITSDEAFYALLEQMYTEIGDNHSIFVSPQKVLEIRAMYGDMPCVGIFGQKTSSPTPTATTETASYRSFNFTRLNNISYDILDENIGYILLPDLIVAHTPQNLRLAVEALEAAGASALIIDIRGNPGGRLVEMMQAAGIFSSGFLWRALTRWTFPLPYPAIGSVATDLPLVILTNHDVNSAAEGFAGALQNVKRATIVGETTAGNVEAVLPFCLRDGSQAWIATGVLAPLRGATWEGVGVVPDIAVPEHEALEAAVKYLLELQP